jgi:hypothetical protein
VPRIAPVTRQVKAAPSASFYVTPSVRLVHDPAEQIEVIRVYGIHNDVFGDLVRVRQQSGARVNNFEFDSYSFHYGLVHQGEVIGTMTVTRASDGPLDCEQAYPSRLVQTFRDYISSPCKFRIQRGSFSSFRTLRTMLRYMWQDQLSFGCRAMLINADLKLVSFYRRIGFDVMDGSEFIHPLLKTSSVCMHMLAEPTRKSFFSDLFEKVNNVIPQRHWQEVIESVGETSEIHESTLETFHGNRR